MARSHWLEDLTIGWILALAFAVSVAILVFAALSEPSYSQFQWVGEGRGVLGWLKGNFTYMSKYNKWVMDGYTKYSRNDQPFVIPGSVLQPSVVVLPRSQTSWMLDQPDNVLSAAVAQCESLHGEYNFFTRHFTEDPYHAKVIHKNLARHLSELIPVMEDEVQFSIETVFGLDTEEWKKVNIWGSWFEIVPHITNRMLVGYPLCRNKEFLKNCVGFTDDVVRNMFLIGLSPKFLRPITGRLASLPDWLHWRRASKFSIPLIRERLHDRERKAAGDPEYESWIEPEDFISWTIRTALIDKNEIEIDPVVISKRIMALEFAAIHTTSLTGHGALIDLMTSDPANLDGIREEAARVLKEEGGHWTKNGLSRLIRLDSAIRESQRINNIALTFVERKVVAAEGVTSKEEGWHLPYGSRLALNLQGLHHDNDIYENADEYDAFRFSRARESFGAQLKEDRASGEGLKLKQTGMVTTNSAHLPFSHGRHACPGRFFVAHELKMAFAYLLLHYDIKFLPEKPKTRYVGALIVPPLEACIEVKRRKVAK